MSLFFLSLLINNFRFADFRRLFLVFLALLKLDEFRVWWTQWQTHWSPAAWAFSCQMSFPSKGENEIYFMAEITSNWETHITPVKSKKAQHWAHASLPNYSTATTEHIFPRQLELDVMMCEEEALHHWESRMVWISSYFHGSKPGLPPSTAANAGAFKYHYSCYATYSLFAVEKSHPGKVVAHQGVFTFLKQRWAHNRRFLQWEKTSTSVQHLSGFAEGQHSVQGCVLLLKWRTLELSIETLWWHEIGEKNPHKIPLSLVKWKWGEESNEFLY